MYLSPKSYGVKAQGLDTLEKQSLRNRDSLKYKKTADLDLVLLSLVPQTGQQTCNLDGLHGGRQLLYAINTKIPMYISFVRC